MVTLGKEVTVDDIERMRERLFITSGPTRGTKWSAFWILLVLAAIIASAGVVADSTATVIGAMIVAPLMTPILGTALALVLAERRALIHNIGLVLVGAVVVVAIGFLLGLLHPGEVVAATNSQVAARVSPRLIDLIAALATGVVGAFALVRADISDTLPGVAIAISLVPPLAVVGLTLESGAPAESVGALLLFTTNVAAIIATGTVVLVGYRIGKVLADAGQPLPALSRKTLLVVVGALVLVAVPLGTGSLIAAREQQIIRQAQPVAERWAQTQGWQIDDVFYQQGQLRIIALGPPPEADAAALRVDLDDAGLSDIEAMVTLVLGGSRVLPASQ